MVSLETLEAVVEAHDVLSALLIKSPNDALLTETLGLADAILAEVKGDASGHAFHGNRYTGGIGGGDTTAGGSLVNGHSPALVAKLSELTQTILPLPRERAYILTKDGGIAATIQGGESTVRVTNREVGVIAAATMSGGAVGLHNHPSGEGTSFSPADVATAFRFGFSEIRVASRPWVYVMRPGKLGSQFPKGHGSSVLDRAEQIYSIGRNRNENTQWHDVWKQVASEYGLEYLRVHVNDKARMEAAA